MSTEKKRNFNTDCSTFFLEFLPFLYLTHYLVLFRFLQKNHLAMEIMRFTFQMEFMVGQAPNGIVHNLTPAQFATYTNMGIQKAELVAGLFALMTNDRDI